jgi:hypothetical protein
VPRRCIATITYSATNDQIGTVSAYSDQPLAKVWNKNYPTPIAAASPINIHTTTGICRPRATTPAQTAAATKAKLLSALTGSAQNPAPTRSQ